MLQITGIGRTTMKIPGMMKNSFRNYPKTKRYAASCAAAGATLGAITFGPIGAGIGGGIGSATGGFYGAHLDEESNTRDRRKSGGDHD
jgi:Glycine zipper